MSIEFNKCAAIAESIGESQSRAEWDARSIRQQVDAIVEKYLYLLARQIDQTVRDLSGEK